MGNPFPEIFNRTLLNMLGTLKPNKKTDWKKYLPSLTYTYNCMRRKKVQVGKETTFINPYKLVFGRKPRFPIDYVSDTTVQREKSGNKGLHSWTKGKDERSTGINEESIRSGKTKMKKGSDKNARSAKINVGDKVLVKIP